MSRLLLLAGTGEAREMAETLHAAGVDVTVSFHGGARLYEGLPCASRSGGFGGDQGFETYLEAEEIGAVLDATHPFAQRVTRRTARICEARGIAHALYWRPEWRAEAGDNWTHLAHEAEAAKHVPRGSTVFVATGRSTLESYGNLQDSTVIARQIEAPDGAFPLPKGRYLVGRGPFTPRSEQALFEQLGIDWLIVKNAGGEGARAKLLAARKMGLPVGMIARPAPPAGVQLASTVDEAVAWGKAHG